MKKTIAIALAALTVCLAPVGASAHHGQRLGQGVCSGIQTLFHHGNACRACAHADTDGNGICDNCGNDWSCPHFDENGDGICDNCGRTWGYVDADGDGVCDNWGSGNGTGSGNGNGTGAVAGSGGHHGGGHHGGRHHG